MQDKAALLSNILIRGLGAIGGNVILNRLKGIIGNVPGASMSVAQTTSNATAELGLNMPAGKVRDIYIRAMTEPDLMRALLAKIPKTEKKAIEYFRSLPAIFYSSGVRGGIEETQQTEMGRVPVNYVEEVYRDVTSPMLPQTTDPFRTTREKFVETQRRLDAERQAQQPSPQPAPPPVAPPQAAAPAPINPMMLQRTAQVLGPQDEIGALAAEMLMRQRPS